ncbi:hypothetical protein [Streptomyces sp. SID12501]|uniref:MarR family transcriptional regulator n=1 Tax=Streptomyces sp. SID12501 TaxID=2706042 RepID=A0A6B3BUK1_9ACTN|nr:hypothetical protein [Streptomyces sp. SID12501]NEC88061.1 hypothetical protein [Streptomyces sp. SID12501]
MVADTASGYASLLRAYVLDGLTAEQQRSFGALTDVIAARLRHPGGDDSLPWRR